MVAVRRARKSTGRFVDSLEVDDQYRKVDEMRQLLENAVYAPTRGRFKVYVIDEVHMFSNSAFNAMLKTLGRTSGARQIHPGDDRSPENSRSRYCRGVCSSISSKCRRRPYYRVTWQECSRPKGSLAILRRWRSSLDQRPEVCATRFCFDQAIAHGSGRRRSAGPEMLGTVDVDYSVISALVDGDADTSLGIADDMAHAAFRLPGLQDFGSLLTRLQVAQHWRPAGLGTTMPERESVCSNCPHSVPGIRSVGFHQIVRMAGTSCFAPDEYAGF